MAKEYTDQTFETLEYDDPAFEEWIDDEFLPVSDLYEKRDELEAQIERIDALIERREWDESGRAGH